jgi:hypothetical protein
MKAAQAQSRERKQAGERLLGFSFVTLLALGFLIVGGTMARTFCSDEFLWPRSAVFGGGALLLIVIGLWLFIGAFIANARVKRDHRRELDLPDQPWLWRQEWRAETIIPEDRDELWFWRWRRPRRFGGVRLRLKTLPGRIGGTLEGTLEMKQAVPAGTDFQVSLTCVRRKITKKGHGDERFEEFLWEDRRVVPAVRVGVGRTAAPLGFEIPPGLLPADGLDSSDQIIWFLSVRAPSLDSQRAIRFRVPVFPADGESADADAATLPFLPQREPEQDQELTRQGVQRFDPGNGGIGFEFPAGRRKAIAIMLVMVLVAIAGVVWALIVKGSPLIAIIFMVVVALVTVYSLLIVWFESYRIQAWPGRLLLQRRFPGRLREREFGLGGFDHLESVQEMQTDNLTYYRLRVVPHEGNQIVAATGVEGMTVAQRVIDEIDEVLIS